MSVTTTSESGEPSYDLNLPPNPLDNFSADERRAHERTLNTPNQTAVGPQYPGGRRRSPWYRLDRHNRDTWWKHREDVKQSRSYDAQYKIGAVSAFGLQLGMSDFLIQKAINVLMEIDLRRLGLNLEEVAFCVCGIVVNRNAEERYKATSKSPIYHPQRSDENNPEAYVRLANRIIEVFERASMKRIRSCWQKLTQTDIPKRENQDWRPIVSNEALVPLSPSVVCTQFTEEQVYD